MAIYNSIVPLSFLNNITKSTNLELKNMLKEKHNSNSFNPQLQSITSKGICNLEIGKIFINLCKERLTEMVSVCKYINTSLITDKNFVILCKKNLDSCVFKYHEHFHDTFELCEGNEFDEENIEIIVSIEHEENKKEFKKICEEYPLEISNIFYNVNEYYFDDPKFAPLLLSNLKMSISEYEYSLNEKLIYGSK